MSTVRGTLTALIASALCAALAPPAATAAGPFSFGAGFGPNHQSTFAVATGPNGDRLVVSDSDYGEVLTARRLVPSSRRAGPARELDSRRGTAHVTDRVGLVYNPRAREYLLVYYWWGTGPGSTELLAQRIAPDGRPRGEERTVSHGLPRGLAPSSPEVVYDPSTGGYLVAWSAENVNRPSPRTLYTQRLDRSGRPLSSRDTKVGDVGATAPRRLVRDGADGTYLVVGIENDGDRVLVTRRLDRTGRPLGRERELGDVESLSFDVAYAPRAGRYVLALARGTSPHALDVRTLSRGGRSLGRALRITAPGRAPGVAGPSLTYAPRTDRFLLSWAFVDDRFHEGYFTYPRAQRVRGDGRRFAGRRLTFGSETGATPAPWVTYDPASGRHLALWAGNDPDLGRPAFFGQIVGG